MLQFILNNKEISTNLPAGTLLLDFVRYHQHLMGTKIGCREGDCGACTILIGELKNDQLTYSSATSCLTPIGNIHGKHIVTIEGINMETLNPVQQAMCDESATQCGFCTPGFVVSLSGFCLSEKEPTFKNAIAAIDGNICRCTGYKSIERATERVANLLAQKNGQDSIDFVVEQKILPQYFSGIKERLIKLALTKNGQASSNEDKAYFVGGGTDLYVQKHEEMMNASIQFLLNDKTLKGISQVRNKCIIGASATVTDLSESSILQAYFPDLQKYIKLISSTPIRNIATVAGNLVNASPIGDLTIFFLALDAQVVLSNGTNTREIPLRKFYQGYKKLDKKPEEFLQQIWFELKEKDSKFNFEKVCKRTHLDIASVNTAIQISTDGELITEANLSAGGVGPIPIFLGKTSNFLKNQIISEEIIKKVIEIAQTEISPISDARGTEAYKRLLLGQLIKAHFVEFFPELEVEEMF